MRSDFWWTDKAIARLVQLVQAAGREWGYTIIGPALDFVRWDGRVLARLSDRAEVRMDLSDSGAASEYDSPPISLTARALALLDEICRLTNRLCSVGPSGELEFYGKLVREPATAQRDGLSIQDIEVQRAFNRGRAPL